MKLRNLLLGGAVALSAIMVSCKEDEPVLAPNVSVSPTSGTLGTEAGSVTLSLTATREWSATVEGDNTEGITVNPSSGSGSNEPVTVTVAAEANPGRTRTVTVVFSCGGKEAGYTLTQEGEMGNKMTIEEVLKAAEGATVETSGLVVAVNARGFIIEDDTDRILVYEYNSDGYDGQPTAAVGDQVNVTGTIGLYSGRNQILPTSIDVTASDQEVTYPASPVVVSSENYSSLELFSFVEMTGRYAVSGEYHNIYIDGITDDVDGSISYPMEEIGGVKLSDVVGHNITVRGYYTGGTSHLSVVVVSVKDNGAVETDEMTIAEVIAAPANSPVETSGKVMAVCQKGFIMDDGNNAIYVDQGDGSLSVAIGNTVTVSGTKSVRNSGPQISSPTIEANDNSTEVPLYDEPVDLTDGTVFAAYDFTESELVRYKGTLSSGRFVNVSGSPDLQGSLNWTIEDYSHLNGKEVTVTGYVIEHSISTNEYPDELRTVVVSVETEPYLSVQQRSANVDASATSAQFEVLSNTSWTVSSESDWISFTESGENDGTIEVTFNANDGEERTATLTVTASDVEPVTLTLVQGAAGVTLDTYTYEFTSGTIKEAGSVTLGNLQWNLETDGGYFGFDSNNGRGQQIGSSSKAATYVNLSTTGISGIIKSVKVNTSGAKDTNAQFSVTIGGESFGDAQSISETAIDYTLSGSASGEIVLKWTQTSKKAVYIKSIEISYEN